MFTHTNFSAHESDRQKELHSVNEMGLVSKGPIGRHPKYEKDKENW